MSETPQTFEGIEKQIANKQISVNPEIMFPEMFQ